MITQDKTLVTPTHVYFLNGPFSQWYPSVFKAKCRNIDTMVDDDFTFHCAEQYMMAQKALLFGDIASFDKIMKAKTPREQKELGRKVGGFDVDIWNQQARSLVEMGNYAKFSQNQELQDYLLSSGDRILVEGAHYDPIWGVGLAWNDPKIQDSRNWKGTNWLGEALMTTRRIIEDKIVKNGMKF